MTILEFENKSPKIDSSVFISQKATVIGDVEIGANSSVWPNAVIRGDIKPIKIGENTNIQDNVVIHASANMEVKIGNNVSIGHSAVLHSCEIYDNSLVGIHAVVLDQTKIESWVLIGAGAVVTPKTVIPSRSLVLGIPSKVVRQLNDADLKYIEENAKNYVKLAEIYRKMLNSNYI